MDFGHAESKFDMQISVSMFLPSVLKNFTVILGDDSLELPLILFDFD